MFRAHQVQDGDFVITLRLIIIGSRVDLPDPSSANDIAPLQARAIVEVRRGCRFYQFRYFCGDIIGYIELSCLDLFHIVIYDPLGVRAENDAMYIVQIVQSRCAMLWNSEVVDDTAAQRREEAILHQAAADEAEDGRRGCIRLIPSPEEVGCTLSSGSNFRYIGEMAFSDPLGIQGHELKYGVLAVQAIYLIECHATHVPEVGNAGYVFRVAGITPGNIMRGFRVPIQREAPDTDSKCLEGEHFV